MPPEINSARMYAGPGPDSMLAAATAWNGLAAELQSTATSYGSVVSGVDGRVVDGAFVDGDGGRSRPLCGVAQRYRRAGRAGSQPGQAAAAAYQSAFAMTVPPALITANRTQLASLIATNVFGQNTSAIAANEAQYGEMWAQDASAMYSYAANSAAAARSRRSPRRRRPPTRPRRACRAPRSPRPPGPLPATHRRRCRV